MSNDYLKPTLETYAEDEYSTDEVYAGLTCFNE